ncbi:MAG TPA: hypothetical protein EYP14_05615, partial [Planctomycetaceae bacterium]|nr:hypothetical protein [Planctomycetaceae bacterium]
AGEDIIEGRRPDRPPFSCWYHFGPEAVAGPGAVDAHLRHVEAYDLDFLKVMDDNRYPRTATADGVIDEPDDLDRLRVLDGDEDSFGRQLELIGELARRLDGELLMATTVFNPWSTLRQMTVPDSGRHGPPTLDRGEDPRDATMMRFVREAPERLERALAVIADSTANFVRQCVSAGADGIFLSVRDDWVGDEQTGPELYDRWVKPGDGTVLAGAQAGRFNLLHICGKARRFDRFTEYPVHVLNWADRYAGPSIAEVVGRVRPAICAGLNNLGTMVYGTPEDCVREVADALQQAGERPIMLSPGCTYDPAAVPEENLQAIRRAVAAANSQAEGQGA